MSQNLSNLIMKVSQKGLFKCKFVGLHYLHNYLMLIREGSLDKNSVLIFDIRSNKGVYDDFHLFKSKQLDLNSLDLDNFA